MKNNNSRQARGGSWKIDLGRAVSSVWHARKSFVIDSAARRTPAVGTGFFDSLWKLPVFGNSSGNPFTPELAWRGVDCLCGPEASGPRANDGQGRREADVL